MIPVLFEKDEINFLNNGLGSLPNVVESYAKQTANSEYELFLVYPTLDEVEGISNKIWEELKIPERQILYKPSHGSEPHAFRIYDYEINTEDETISVYARSRAYDLAGNPIKDVVIQSKTPQAAMNTMKAALMEPTDFEFYSDITTPSSTTWTKRSGLSTIMGQSGSLIQIWGGEVFRENRKISLLRRAGKDNVTSLRLGKNINQLEYDFSADGMVTAIIPYCTFTTDGEDAKEITLVGDTVKSPKFYNYRLPYYEFIEFTEEDGVVDLLTLNNAASNWFNEKRGIDEPNVSISVDMMDIAESTEYGDILKKLETVNVFDTLSVYIEKYNIDLLIKVNTLKYDGIGERNLEVELGNVTKSLFESFVSPDFKTIEEQINEAKKIGLTAQGSANGKNTNYHGHDDPNQLEVVGQNGDIYFREIFNERQMWEFYNGQWNLIIDTSENTSIKNSVDEAQAKAEEAKQEAENAYNDAVAEADRLVTSQTEAFDAEMALRKGEITAVKNNIDAELVRVDQAISDNFTSLSDTLGDVDAISKQAKLDAQTAASNAQTALSNAKTAISTATSANNKAIKSSVIEWALSASGTTPPTTGWSTTVPTPSTTQYTWGRTTITLNDGTTIPSYNVSKMGVKGDPGAPGAGGAKGDKGDAGVNAPKITAVKQYFYLSSSNTSQTGGSWTETIPVWSSGKYYWTRVVTSYDNATTTESVPVLDNSLNQSLVTSLEAKSATQTLSTTVSQHATQIALKASQTSVDSLTGRVGTSETNISANATAINLRATKASVDTLTGRVSAAEASISVQAGKIDLAATKTELTTAIDGIEVGGRNLLTGTSEEEQEVKTSSWSIGFWNPSLVTGEEYTFSFDVRSENATRLDNVFLNNSNNGFVPNHPVTKEWARVSFTFRWKGGTYNGREFSPHIYPRPNYVGTYVSRIKLEKGNKATDWTPAPEDVDASITTVQSNLTVEAGKISAVTARVSGTESSIASVKQTADGNKATVANHAGQISTINQTVSGLQTTVADKASQSQVTQLANGLSSVVTDLSNLEIGGRNLVLNTGGKLYRTFGVSATLSEVNGATRLSWLSAGQTSMGEKLSVPLVLGESYTLTFEARGTISPRIEIYILASSGGNLNISHTLSDGVVTGEFKKYTATFKFTGNPSYSLFIGGSGPAGAWLEVKDSTVKLEKGNKATDWTPAPEEMATQSQITQLSTSISTKVESATYNSKMTQLDNAINLRVVQGDVTAAILADKKIKDTRATNQIPSWYFTNYPSQRIEEFKSRPAIGLPGVATYAKLLTDVPWPDSSGGSIFQTAYSADGVYNRSSNGVSAWTAWVKQTDSANVLAQVNLSTEGVLIQGKRIQLDGDVTMTAAYVTKLNTQTLTAITANITSIRASILTADVITSGMVATSTALITKIFATDATVTTLTGKTAFINSVKAVTIAADKITSGTLNAANVNIINLNVSKLVGNISNFVQSAWNAINSTVSITGDGIVSSNSAGRFVHYSNGGVVFGGGGERILLRNNTGATTNRSGISLEPVGSNLNAVDFDIATRGTSAFHMGTSDHDLGYRLRLANSDTNTNNYYISLKTGSQFDFELGKSTAANTSKNTLEIQRYDANGNIRIGKNATFGASMFISGNDIIFAKGGTTSRVNVYANRFVGTGYTYLEGSNVYSIEKTISHMIQQLQWYTSYFSATKWQTA